MPPHATPHHKPVRQLSLMVDATNKCQLGCTYCYYGTKGAKTMDVPRVAQAVENVARALNGDLRQLDLHYMGGEPLIAWKEIRALTARTRTFCAKRSLSFSWGATSNLVALDEDKARVMMAEGANIHCSIDGPAEIHNRNRPYRNGHGSFSDVVRRIPLALQITPQDTARVTVVPEDAGELVRIVDAVLGFGFKTVGLFPAYEAGWTDHSIATWAKHIALAYRHAQLTGNGQVSTIVKPRPLAPATRKSFSYCGAGRGLWALDVSGNLYHCHHFTNQPTLAICDAATASVEAIAAAMAESALSPFGKPIPSGCQTCPVLGHCHGLCWANNLMSTGNAATPRSVECRMFQATHATLWPIMEPNTEQPLKHHACSNCYSCQNCYHNCDSCQGCDGCQGCQECQNCYTCQSTCEKCQSCDTGCQDCQDSCERCERCNTCESCQSSYCEGCQSCESRSERCPCANCDQSGDF